jgi:hypothetical protein
MQNFNKVYEQELLKQKLNAIDNYRLRYNKKTGMFNVVPKRMAWFPKDRLFKLALLGCIIGIPIISGLAVFT